MWIVRFALQRPYTFVIIAVPIAIFGGAAIATTPTGYSARHQHPDCQRESVSEIDRASAKTYMVAGRNFV
jgi:hypothetical protein